MIEQQFREELIGLLTTIKTADSSALMRSMENIEKLLSTNRSQLDPQLVHFLERRSYAKALAYMGGSTEIPAGVCAPRNGK